MIDFDIIITGGVGLVSSTISAVVSWIMAKKKYDSEVDTTVIENMQKSLDFYKILADDNNERLKDILRRNECLEGEVNELRKQMYEIFSSICYNLTCQHRQHTKNKINELKTEEEI